MEVVSISANIIRNTLGLQLMVLPDLVTDSYMGSRFIRLCRISLVITGVRMFETGQRLAFLYLS